VEDARKILSLNLAHSIEAKKKFLADEEQLQSFCRAAEIVVGAYRQGGRLMIAGNGGSAADAQHLAAEFVSKLARDRSPLPAEALTTDSSILTAIGNDYGFDHVFSRQIEGKARTGDVFLGITTSGRSANIINAVKSCRRIGVTSIVFSGRGGGAVKQIADICVVASGDLTSTIQEMHIVLAHSLCETVERALFPE